MLFFKVFFNIEVLLNQIEQTDICKFKSQNSNEEVTLKKLYLLEN